MLIGKPLSSSVLESCFLVLGSWVLVLGSWFLVLGSWFLGLGSWVLVLGSWVLGLGSWFLGLGSWFRKCLRDNYEVLCDWDCCCCYSFVRFCYVKYVVRLVWS